MLAIAVGLFAASVLATLPNAQLAATLIAKRRGIVDTPGPRNIHIGTIPLSGGWVIFACLSHFLERGLVAAVLIPSDGPPSSLRYYFEVAPSEAPKIAVVWGGAAAIFVIGLLDDIRGLSVRVRFVGQIGFGVVRVALGLRATPPPPPTDARRTGRSWPAGASGPPAPAPTRPAGIDAPGPARPSAPAYRPPA